MAISLAAGILGFIGNTMAQAPPAGNPLPSTSLFDLVRQSDLVVRVRATGGDSVRVEEVIGQKQPTVPTLNVANFGRLRRGLFPTSPPLGSQEPAASEAILFLRRYGKQWWILETIPRARAANGCIWVRNNQVFFYSRNPWTKGSKIIERPLAVSTSGRIGSSSKKSQNRTLGSSKSATLSELLDALRGWQRDLAQLRQMDKMTSPVQQLRALRAFITPTTKPQADSLRYSPHSPEALPLARRVYREVADQADAIREGKTSATETAKQGQDARAASGPIASSAWSAVRRGQPPAVVQSLARTQSASSSERLTGLQGLSLAAVPEVMSAALRGLGDTSPTVRLAAAHVLGDFAEPSCSSTLLAHYRAVKDRSDPMRRALLRALATTEEPCAVAELISTLQEPDDPLRDDIVQLLFWLSGYRTAKGTVSESYLSASWWATWYQKRFGQKIEVRPWDFARLETWIARRRGMSLVLPASEWKTVSPKTIEEILGRCANPSFPNRDRWCELLLHAWNAGVLAAEQQKAILDTFGRATLEGRSIYPLGSRALLRISSGWPAIASMPTTLHFLSKSQVYVDGTPVGRAYPYPYPGIYVSRLYPGDYGPGPHRLKIATEYSVRTSKGTSVTETVESPELQFEVAFPDQEYGLEAKTDPQLDAQVKRAFRFVSLADESTSDAKATVVPSAPTRRKWLPSRLYRSSGGYFEVFGHNRWELTEKLPVDLAFDVEYELPEIATVLPGTPIYVPQGTTATAAINPFSYLTRALEKPGTYRFRVHLTPSRDVALSHPDSRAYWDGFILTSPEMTIRVTKPPADKKS